MRIVREGTSPLATAAPARAASRTPTGATTPSTRTRRSGSSSASSFQLDGDGRYALRGIIDRLVRARDGALEIHDYKTGRRVPSQDELDRDRQLALYEIGVRARLGEAGEVRLVWHYVVPGPAAHLDAHARAARLAARGHAGTIDRIRTESEWAPRPSALCGWCEYRAHCPAFGGARPEPGRRADVEPDEAELGQLALS